MRSLILALFIGLVGLTSCSKDEENEVPEGGVEVENTTWQGSGIVGGAENVKVTLQFMSDGVLKGRYEPNPWSGTYSFNKKTQKGVAIEVDGDFKLEMPFEIKDGLLHISIDPGRPMTLKKIK